MAAPAAPLAAGLAEALAAAGLAEAAAPGFADAAAETAGGVETAALAAGDDGDEALPPHAASKTAQTGVATKARGRFTAAMLAAVSLRQ